MVCTQKDTWGVVLVRTFQFHRRMIIKGENKIEKTIRTFALVAGFLIYFTIRAIGFSIPDLIVQSVFGRAPLSFGIVGGLLPLIIGIAVTWYCLDAMKRKGSLPGRIVILISTFILTLFIDVYVAVIKVPTGDKLDTSLLPNLTFVIGLSLFAIFSVRQKNNSTLS